MSPVLKIAHWVLNALLAFAALACILVGVFLFQGSSVSVWVNRIGCVLAGLAFGYLTYGFTKYTLNKG